MTTVKATVRKLPESLKVEADIRGFKVQYDELPAKGGTDTAPNPVEMIAATLGACQSMMAWILAQKMRIELKGFWVEVEGDIDPEGLAGKAGVRKGLQELRYTMHFQSDAPVEKLEQLAAMVEKTCPVEDTLGQGTRVVRAGVVRE